MVGSNALVRFWYVAIAVLVCVALVGQVSIVIDHDRSLVNYFSYFTVQSNILVLAMSTMIVIDPEREGRAASILRLAALTGITVTGLVYGTVIAPHVNPQGAELVFDVIFHYVVPSLSVLGFLLLGPRMALARGDMAFMAWPAVWIFYTMIRGGVSHPGYPGGARYPYGFLDVDLHGWGTVLPNILAVTVLLVGLAAGFIWASRRLGRPAPST